EKEIIFIAQFFKIIMCKQCELNPVYEFTNKRKLCKNCFVNYFLKKLLYTIRKFKMIRTGDIIGYKKTNTLKGVVLGDLLFFFKKKYGTEITELPSKKINKIASDSSLDSESNEILSLIIEKNSADLEKELPVEKNLIKPLYLFLDEEILLYAKIKNLKFKSEKIKKNKINNFLNGFENKHPEVKRAVVNSLLELYEKK
ncbi:MAG: hypothetical protein AABX99_04430, partial [Nanoarchaeota archaeon]